MRWRGGPSSSGGPLARTGATAGAGVTVATVILAALALVPVVAGCKGRPASSSGGTALEVVASIGEVGISPGQFAFPRALDFDGEDFWVIDKAARVQRLDGRTGEPLSLWTMPDFERGKPTGVTLAPDVAVDSSGRDVLWIPDTHYHRVMVYRLPADRRGRPELAFQLGGFGKGPSQFIYPNDVAVLHEPDGKTVRRVYVAEYGGNDRISIFEHAEAVGGGGGPELRFVKSFGAFGQGEDARAIEFSRPQSMAIDARRGELIVTDACNHRLGRFTLEGELIGWIGSAQTAGDEPGRFRYPYGLCVLGDGSVLVTEFGNSRVQRIDVESGRCLGVYGRPGHGPGELATPWAITAGLGRAYVLDSGNNRLVGFEIPGAPVAAGVRP